MLFAFQFSYATVSVTAHKVQSLNLKKINIFLGKSQYAFGLDYVMFSRVAKITDIIIIDDCISKERIVRKQKSTRMRQHEREENRFLTLQKINNKSV